MARHLAGLPESHTTPELRIDCDEERKFAIVAEAAEYFGARYPVNTIDGIRISWPDGWGLLRASNTQAVLVLRFEATTEAARDAHQAEVMRWLADRGVHG